MTTSFYSGSPQGISMQGNSYPSAGGALSQSHIHAVNNMNTLRMFNDVNSNDSSPFDLNDFPQLSSRPSSAGGSQGQLGMWMQLCFISDIFVTFCNNDTHTKLQVLYGIRVLALVPLVNRTMSLVFKMKISLHCRDSKVYCCLAKTWLFIALSCVLYQWIYYAIILYDYLRFWWLRSFLFGMSCRMKFMLSLSEGLLDLMHNYLQCLALLLLHFVPMLLLIGFYRYMLLFVCQASVLYVVNLVKMP